MPRRITREEFINKSQKVHGSKYDYSRAKYVNGFVKVEIICPEHGSFQQSPRDHLAGKGCYKCGVSRRVQARTKDPEVFIQQARKVHGDKYGYDLVVYINSTTKVEIVCPKHGPFWQIPDSHLLGHGCLRCGYTKNSVSRVKNIEVFIKQAKEVHGDKYGYDYVVYRNSGIKVEIVCPKHGPFWQIPSSHLQGRGCPRCGKEQGAEFRAKTAEIFIQQAKEVHGDKYRYDSVVYKHSGIKVKIICPKHGPFSQWPMDHIRGIGCRKCATERITQVLTKDPQMFPQQAREVHGDKYRYDHVVYVNGTTEVEIICPKHGPFWQKPSNHLQGAGCHICSASQGERRIVQLLRLWQIRFTHQKRFNACRDKLYLPFDFYFRIGKLNFLIEYDGIQHFDAQDHFGGEEYLSMIQRHDAIKTQFAQAHGFVLIRIPYTEYGNIEAILTQAIETHTGKSLDTIITGHNARHVRKSSISPLRGYQQNLF